MEFMILIALAAMAGAFSLWCPCGYSIAETVTHTVSGWRRLRVRSILLLATTLSAAVFGFFMGLLPMAFDVSTPSAALVAGLAVLGLGADQMGKRWRAFKPLAVGRQVPREWGIVFSPEVVSVLYGLRLGIAPLTILASWVWWVAVIAAAFHGPWLSALVGVTFGVSRIVVSELATARTTTNSMACRMETVRGLEQPLRIAGAIALVVATSVAVINPSPVPQAEESYQEQLAQR